MHAAENIVGHVMVSDYDSRVEIQWKISFGIAKTLKKDKSDREGGFWYSPHPSWHKINFDGLAKGNPGPVGCGGVLRDHNGRFVSTVELPLGI